MVRAKALVPALLIGVLVGCAGAASGQTSPPAADEQVSALQDGVVSQDEYAASYLAVADCLGDRGHRATQEADGGGLLSIIVESPDESAAAQADIDYQECFSTYASEIAVAWAQQQAAGTDRHLVYRRTLACLETALGLDLSDVDPTSPAELSKVIVEVGEVEYGRCFEQESEALATVIESGD